VPSEPEGTENVSEKRERTAPPAPSEPATSPEPIPHPVPEEPPRTPETAQGLYDLPGLLARIESVPASRATVSGSYPGRAPPAVAPLPRTTTEPPNLAESGSIVPVPPTEINPSSSPPPGGRAAPPSFALTLASHVPVDPTHSPRADTENEGAREGGDEAPAVRRSRCHLGHPTGPASGTHCRWGHPRIDLEG
jgi:hypothetical protein